MKKYDIVWYVGIRKKQSGLFDTNAPFHVIPNPKRQWAADPFLFEHQGKTYLFVELFCNDLHRGCIGVCEVTESGITPYRPVIIENYHMSYPYIWEDSTGIHMCAETGNNKTLHFYKAVEFPYKWEVEKELLSGKIWVDTTFIHDENGLPVSGVTYEYDENWQIVGMVPFALEGSNITVSPEKPITTGLDYERCGGNFLMHNGKTYRVAQNCGPSYGHNLAFCEVKSRWPRYEETMSLEIALDAIKKDAKFTPIGTHTYNATSQYEVIDFRCHEFHWDTFLYGTLKNLYGKLRRLLKK